MTLYDNATSEHINIICLSHERRGMLLVELPDA